MTKTIFEMTTPTPSDKVKDKEYKNWLKVTLALCYMKSGLHTFVQNEVDCLHKSLLQNIHAGHPVPAAHCTTCHAKCVRRNKHTRDWTFQNQCKLSCDKWFHELLALHNNPKSDKIYWANSDVSLWPFNPWECAKVFLPRGQQHTTGPAESDAQALMVLLANCKHFHPKLSQHGLMLTHTISNIRNKVMHHGEMKVSDGDRTSFLQQIIQLLEDSVSLMSLEDCKAAVCNIHKIDNDSVDVFFSLDLEMTALRAAVKELRQELGIQEIKNIDNIDTLKEEYRQLIAKWFEDVEKKLELHVESTTKRFEDVKSKLELNEENIKVNVVKLQELEEKVELHGQRIAAAENIEFHGGRLGTVEKKVELQGEKLGAVEQIIVKQQEGIEQIAGENSSCMKAVTFRSCGKDGVHFELKKLAEKIQDSHQGRGMNGFENKEFIKKNDLDKQEYIEMAKGYDGIICVMKQYPYLKSDMSKKNIMAIAKGLLDKELIIQDEYDRFTDFCQHSRRQCIDMLLKKVIREESNKSELLKCFLDQLRSQDQDMAMRISKTEVTETDRKAFHQVNQNGVVKRNAYMTLKINCRIPDTEIVFFQGRLCDSPECVDSINDKLLSNFFISIIDHSLVMQSKDEMIHTLFNMMQYYHLDNESVFEVVLEQRLFEEWKTLRNGSPEANRKTTLTMQSTIDTGTAMVIARDDEVANLYCFCWLVMDVGKFTLQSFLTKQYSAEGDLHMFLKSKERQVNMLYSKHIIKQWQRKILKPTTGNSPEVKDLDISTICILLIYLCQIEKPLNGWKELPSENDKSVGADILRLLFAAENIVFCCIAGGMNACAFSEKWNNIHGAISRLMGQLVQEDIADIMRRIAFIKKENIYLGMEKQINVEIYKVMVSKTGNSQDVKLSEIITMDVSEICSDQGNQSSFGTLLSWMKNAARALLNGFAQRLQSRLIGVDEGSIILKLRVLKDLKLELLNKDFIGKSLRSLIRKGCFETKVKLTGPVLVTVYILSPADEGKKDEIHFHLDLEALKHDAQQLRGAHEVQLQSKDIKLLVEEIDPIGLQHWMFDRLQIDINKQKRMNAIVSWQTLSRSDRMEILLDSLKMVDNGFDMLAQYCKENEPYVYERVFKMQEQLSCPEESDTDQNAELSYQKGGGLQKLYSMKLDLDIDDQVMSDQDIDIEFDSCLMDEREEDEYVVDKECNKSNDNRLKEENFNGSVHYILKESMDKNPKNIFAWLGISPNLLQKSTPIAPENDVILYIQWSCSRVFDDIVSMRRLLSDYAHVTGTTTIYILAMSTIDGEKKHLHDCMISRKVTNEGITFIEIHCSYDDKIYNCRGNSESKDFLSSELTSARHENGHTASGQIYEPSLNVDLEKKALTTAINEVRQELGIQEKRTFDNIESLEEEYKQLKKQLTEKLEDVKISMDTTERDANIMSSSGNISDSLEENFGRLKGIGKATGESNSCLKETSMKTRPESTFLRRLKSNLTFVGEFLFKSIFGRSQEKLDQEIREAREDPFVGWDKKDLQKELTKMKASILQNCGSEPVRIVVCGASGAGKSSFVNSINTALRGKVIHVANSGGRDIRVTGKYTEYKILGNINIPILVICDTRGTETSENGAAMVKEAVKGTFASTQDMDTVEARSMMGQRARVDAAKYIVFVVDASMTAGESEMARNTFKIMSSVQEFACENLIPMCVIVTKCDKLDAAVRRDITNLYKSERVETARCFLKEKFWRLPKCRIFPFVNNTDQMELEPTTAFHTLYVLKHIVSDVESYMCDVVRDAF